ncbi:MAG: iron-sulfur cluster assembly accessory protein [Alphaproteobacteria bacterium]|nr:iron-sulfur cluster assembly accessory protein [Alphaproteobacteria bacterium]
MAEHSNIVSLTDAAVARVGAILAKADTPHIGLRIGVKSVGCSGLSYKVDYADEIRDNDIVIEQDGVTIVVEPTATLFLIGSEIDYQEDKMQSGFVFTNPNEKGRCGCGESFHV